MKTDDILVKIKKEFEEKSSKSKIIIEKIKKIKNKKATYQDANEMAVEVGEVLKSIFSENITKDTLESEKIYFEVAKKLINPNLINNYEIVAGYSQDVQKILNEKAGLSIKPQKAEINQERIDNLIIKISSYDDFNKGKWLLEEPVVNFTQAIVDDTIKKNIDFHYKAGLKPKIKRKERPGGCCDWCKKLANTYNYPDEVPDDVYRRHRFCRCTVEYMPEKGKRQNVWTKREHEARNERILKAERVKDIKELNREVDRKQYTKLVEILGEDAPKTFTLFQNLKYNKAEEYKKLKTKAFIKEKKVTGQWGTRINIEKQATHNELTKEKGKSYLFKEVDAQKLFDKYSGEGEIEKNRHGRTNRELCIAEDFIGVDINSGNKTKMFKIHHSKVRTHIVPYDKKEK